MSPSKRTSTREQLQETNATLLERNQQLAAAQQEVAALKARLHEVDTQRRLRRPTQSRVSWATETFAIPLVPIIIGLFARFISLIMQLEGHGLGHATAGVSMIDFIWNTEWPIATMLLYAKLKSRLQQDYPDTLMNSIDKQKLQSWIGLVVSGVVLGFYFLNKERILGLGEVTILVFAGFQISLFFSAAKMIWIQDTDDRKAWAEAFNLRPEEVGLSPKEMGEPEHSLPSGGAPGAPGGLHSPE